MENYHRPRKRFGQNFLHDQNVISAIIAAAQLDHSDKILEIGPGQGALTDKILPHVATLDIIEIDRDLAQSFVARNDSKLTVHIADALRLDWGEILHGDNYKLIANLPYNISTQILFKMLEQRQHFARMILMFQKEVGDRLRAQPGTKEYGALTVMCQLWFDVSRVTLVPPQAFRPPPKIMSEVLKFDRLAQPRVHVDNPVFFQRVVKAAFAQRRKTLRNCLCAAGFSPDSVDSAAKLTAIDMHRRGETLSIQEFSQLAVQLYTTET
ncbi:MAG: 16S rRNA (adenine(1518)-N(6)/adenine(1519)-N(6))-dimethyltransferase RsmA [Desulfuromonas sp.]|nr:16S rRNA (adenine(1518)-N(6)/adenine(1519)-N(6))-dimethyltransferase RsmA [Desulfuromonas sp.]